MIDTNNVNDLVGATVYGDNDDKIGTVGQVYVDTDSQAPLWVTIKTGLFGTGESFAPLESASYDGDAVRIPYEKSFVKDAPRIADDGSLSQDEENSLYAYYGNGAGGNTSAGTSGNAQVGYDTSGPTTDDAMTRSEEQLHVGTEKVEAGRARLRKHVVTEQQTVTVPVSHEEVTLSREPITEANIGNATAGPDLSDEEHEVVLTEERVVVQKEAVPVERVALGTETVTEQQQVTEDVAHEEIELVDPTTAETAARN
ncbi:MAG: hypothetical protein JWQ19_4027 [Subtercola sp.]|nr:hypothetical protein [Subtercola sp.]